LNITKLEHDSKMEFKEKVTLAQKILIYGGSGGIGSATGRILHARGYNLHLVGRDKERLAAIAIELGATSTLGDVNDSSLFIRAAQDSGAVLNGLVYAVGTINLRSLGRLTAADFLTDFRLGQSKIRLGRYFSGVKIRSQLQILGMA
jgi:NADP-dependent 3-hydroxy acid dehydrogenase YdfG